MATQYGPVTFYDETAREEHDFRLLSIEERVCYVTDLIETALKLGYLSSK